MEETFDELIKKINDIEINSNSNADIVEKTIKTLAKTYNIDNSIIIKFKDLHKINQKFYDKHSKKNIKIKEKVMCVLCQENIKSREHKIHLDKCSHCFHKKCLNKYLKIIKINFKCPVCLTSYKNSFCNIIKNDYNLIN
jgi:hypothetical protein